MLLTFLLHLVLVAAPAMAEPDPEPSPAGAEPQEQPSSDVVEDAEKYAELVASGEGEPIRLGSLDKGLINATIQSEMDRFRYCYQRELRRDPTLAGSLVIRFVIEANGKVSEASVKRNELVGKAESEAGTKVASCAVGSFLRLRFPEPEGNGIVIVSYPFVFKPG